MIDWEALRSAAFAATAYAYAPYSGLAVGAAAFADDGRIIAGCNVENASYGLTLCAECAVVSALHSGGGGRLRALVCVNGAGETLMPCGRCRQLIAEHAAPGLLIATVDGPRTIAEMLPLAFGPSDVEEGGT
ncbi:MAG: cytidine deaminase [Leucobacter sp.]